MTWTGPQGKEPGISAAEPARKLDVPTNRISGILKGQRPVTGDTALRLAQKKVRKAIRAPRAIGRSEMRRLADMLAL